MRPKRLSNPYGLADIERDLRAVNEQLASPECDYADVKRLEARTRALRALFEVVIRREEDAIDVAAVSELSSLRRIRGRASRTGVQYESDAPELPVVGGKGAA